jgi:hypothetical protein
MRAAGSTILPYARRLPRGLLSGAALLFLATYIVVALLRLSYPFELEWMEGVMVDHVRRLLAGQAIYAKPSIEFVSLLYPPLYYVIAAGAAKALGVGFLPLRLVSFASSLGVFAFLFAIVRRETGAKTAGLVAAGLFVATYARAGGWFDLARLDSCYLCVLLASVFTLRTSRSAAGAVGAGLLLGAAFLTKQSTLVVAAPLALGAMLGDVRRGCWFAGAAGLAIGGSTLLLDRATGGWFTYYCFTLPAHHPRVPGAWAGFWTADLLPVLGVAGLVAAVAVVRRCTTLRAGDSWRFFCPLLAAGMVGSSWLVRTLVGAEVNNLLPAYAAVSILAAIGLDDLWRWRVAGDPRASRAWPARVAEALLVGQFALLAYDPRAELPTAADRAAGDRIVAELSTVRGDVFLPHHGYLAVLAGKRSFAHALAMDNVFLDDTGPGRRDLPEAVIQALREARFGAAVVESDGWHAELIRSRYPACRPLLDRSDVFWPVTGAHLRPALLCVVK